MQRHQRQAFSRGWLMLCGILPLLCTLLFHSPSLVQAQSVEDESEFSASGFNTLRIEQEDKLLVPSDQADAVWQFLLDYLVSDPTQLQALDPLFTAYAQEEAFTDTYFDTPTLQLLGQQNGVRHRQRINLTNPDDRKSGRELLQIKVNHISQNAFERGEYKFDISYPQTVSEPDDAHPLFGIVKPAHRPDVKQRLTELGLDPEAMRPILTIHDLRKRIYILRNDEPFMSISLDHVTANYLWAQVTLVEIEPELNEVAFTEADATTRQYMEEIGAQISAMVMAEFPAIQRDLTPKYNKVFQQFENQIPALRFLIRTEMDNLNSLGGLLFVLLMFPLLGGVFLYHRIKGTPAPPKGVPSAALVGADNKAA
jgi:hypothetical protein